VHQNQCLHRKSDELMTDPPPWTPTAAEAIASARGDEGRLRLEAAGKDKAVIDLQKFCSTDNYRPNIMNPFSDGAYTYATNGHIIVRVPRRADIPEREDSPSLERLFKIEPSSFSSIARKDILAMMPEREALACKTCSGLGRAHKCPTCECVCVECSGTCISVPRLQAAISAGTRDIDAHYAMMLMELPGLKISVAEDDVLWFRFDGGDGMLMTLNRFHNIPVVGSMLDT
jgi:hypothetical protein